MRTEFARLLKVLRKSYPDVDLSVVRAAYRCANEAHEGQVRLSGEPYIMHGIAVAKILSQIGLDVTTITAGLLHDVLEDTTVTQEDLKKEFGDEITYLVEGVTKIGNLYPTASPAPSPEPPSGDGQFICSACARLALSASVSSPDLADSIRSTRCPIPPRSQTPAGAASTSTPPASMTTARPRSNSSVARSTAMRARSSSALNGTDAAMRS